MAEAEAGRIVAEAEARWPVSVALQHRTSTLHVGDVAVVVAASAAHRDAAFAACRFLIDALKETLPMWKKEVYADGHSWIGDRS